ncbi:MAG: hypothetical protein IKB20_02840 [Clostridia bacterium]|nr:hypothetical protein [Clostridia bacterium]
MTTEENVYEKELQTEGQGADGEKGEASAVLGKFKDVNALARAYGALQAEFTRRSQRLKVLEKEAEKSARSGAEKLRKNAEVRRAENKKFDDFVASATMAKEPSSQDPVLEENQASKDESLEQISTNEDTVYEMNAVEEGTSQGETAETELEKGVPHGAGLEVKASAPLQEGDASSSVAVSDDAADPSTLLYAKVCQDEKVRLRIIGEYLSSIGRTGAPLMTSGVGTLATPPLKAKSISEAGDMALRLFKKPAMEL